MRTLRLVTTKPLCVGFGAACALARQELADDATRLRDLRERLYQGLHQAIEDIQLNGAPEPRLPGTLAELPELALSTGAACASASQEPSPVLRALGLSDEAIQGSIRIGLGRATSACEIGFAIERLAAAAHRLRAG